MPKISSLSVGWALPTQPPLLPPTVYEKHRKENENKKINANLHAHFRKYCERRLPAIWVLIHMKTSTLVTVTASKRLAGRQAFKPRPSSTHFMRKWTRIHTHTHTLTQRKQELIYEYAASCRVMFVLFFWNILFHKKSVEGVTSIVESAKITGYFFLAFYLVH